MLPMQSLVCVGVWLDKMDHGSERNNGGGWKNTTNTTNVGMDFNLLLNGPCDMFRTCAH